MTEEEKTKAILQMGIGRTNLGIDEESKIVSKALEKQIPKKVIRKDIREYARFYCPNNHFIFEEHCKIFVLCRHDFSKSVYCECCGQKLDWSEWQ